jgi:hypothetical protein
MPAKDEKTQELWVDWTRDAVASYEAPADVDEEDVLDDMVEFAASYADAMLEEFAHRFEAAGARKRRSKRKSKRSRLDDDDPDDDPD